MCVVCLSMCVVLVRLMFFSSDAAFSGCEKPFGMFGEKSDVDQFENHIRSCGHGLFGIASGGNVRGLDGSDG